MKIFNIDTLSVSGQGTLCVVEGPDNTPIPIYKNLPMQANVKILIEHLELTLRNRKTFTGDIKRIIMLFHLLKRFENRYQLTDLVFNKSFLKSSYVMFYERGISCKVLLGLSNNTLSLKTVTIHTIIFKDTEISEGIAKYDRTVEDLRKRISEANAAIDNVFNNYY
jgi:hypothetical protein